MPTITYTAKRSLITGHVADELYELEVALSAADPRTRTGSNQHVPLAGYDHAETVLNRIDRSWSFTTTIQGPALRDNMLEFLDSVVSGESFTIDYPTLATYLLAGDYTEQRVGNLDLWRISFRGIRTL